MAHVPHERRRQMAFLGRLALTLTSGAIGGAMFWLVSLPLPWMLGSMCVVAALAISGGPVVSAKRIRPPLAAVIGVTMGSAFSPQIVSHIGEWAALTIATVVSTIMMGLLGLFYLKRFAGFDLVTSYFAAMPAGVYEMTHQGGLLGGDERRIALIQAVRIFLIVLLIPIAFRWIFDLGAALPDPHRGGAKLEMMDATLLALCAIVGWPAAKLLRFPNPPLLGPLIASATVHGVGLTETAPPQELVSLAQVVLGASIGGQFIGASLRDIRSTMAHGIALIPMMIGICVLVSALAGWVSEIEFSTLMLALAPGGIAEMSLIAFALHAEVAAVVTHQVLRVLMVHGLATTVFKLVRRSSQAEHSGG